MNKRIFVVIFILLIQGFALSDTMAQAKLEVKTDALQITVGDPIHYFVTATVDTSKARLKWASYPDTFNTLEITEKGKIDTTRNGTTVTYKQRLLITGFDSGSFLIPRFVFNTGADTLFTDSFRIAVNTVPVDTNKAFKGIKGIVEVNSSWKDYLVIILALLIGVGILAWVIFYFLRNKKIAQQKKESIPAETYHEKTLRLLNELDNKQLWQQDKPKEYYTELSGIIRQYIEVRFNTNAMELTTDELLHKAKKHREMAVFGKSLKPLLHAADLAKFAKANPLPEEYIEALELAKEFVKISKPKEEPLTNLATNTTPKK